MDRILSITPVFNRRATSLALLDRLRAQTSPSFVLDSLVIDDGSNDGTAEAIRAAHPEVALLRGDGSLWWGGALNLGFDYALEHGYDSVYVLNDDIGLRDDTLAALHRAATANPGAVCASFLLKPDGSILSAQYPLSPFLRKRLNPLKGRDYATFPQELLENGTLPSQSALIPISVLRKGLRVDTGRFPHNYSDTDFFRRVRAAGHKLLTVRASVILSSESSSNFHRFLISCSWPELWRSFSGVKYAHNLRTQANIAFKDSNPVAGALRFVLLLAPYLAWTLARAILPRPLLLRLLRSRLGETGNATGTGPS